MDVLGLDEPGVDEIRNRISFLAGRRHFFDVGSVVPGHEEFIGVVALAEYLLPVARGAGAGFLPGRAEFRNQPVAVRDHIVDQLRGHGPAEGSLRRGTVVAGVAVQTHFVLDLDHDDRLLAGIHFADVAQQRREGAGIRVAVGFAEGGQDGDRLAGGRLGQGVFLLVLFHPQGDMAGHAVLPGSEPQEDEVHVVGAGLADQIVHAGKIKLALLGRQLLPVDRGQQGVETGLAEFRPELFHIQRARGAGAGEFTGQGQEWLAVDDELRGFSALLQMRGFCKVLLHYRCR